MRDAGILSPGRTKTRSVWTAILDNGVTSSLSRDVAAGVGMSVVPLESEQ